MHFVAFVDFGMSEEMKKCCQNQGELIRLHVADVFIDRKNQYAPRLFYDGRGAAAILAQSKRLVQKTTGLSAIPFTVPLDRSRLSNSRQPKTSIQLCDENLTIAKDMNYIPEDPIYNSGVFALKEG
jgi:hypothetical protein